MMIHKFLPGFTPLKPAINLSDKCVLTITKNYLSLNKRCFNNFHGYPFLEFMVNTKDHLLAVKKTDKNDPHAVKLSISKASYNPLNNRGIFDQIKKMDVRKKKTKHVIASVVNDDYMIFDLGD